MTGVLWLVPVALAMGLAGLAAFIWSLGAAQYDDPEGNAVRILVEEDKPEAPIASNRPGRSAGIDAAGERAP